MTHIVTVRPEPGATATRALGEQTGLDIACHPLFEIRPCEWFCSVEDVDAILLGSANAIRHGGPGLAELQTRSVHCVGEMTAFAAREAGFTIASTGSGGLQNVLDEIAGPIRLLRLAGADHVPLQASEGVEIETCIVYESVAQDMPDGLAEMLRQGALVLLHSAIAAEHLASEVDRLDIARESVSLAALGPRIASAAGEGWQRVESAPQPSDAALLALARDMCH